jgi:Leucine-rich repeat (LRR) protein
VAYAFASTTARQVLHLQGNSIVQLTGLENSTELQDLRLDKNRIRQLDVNSVLSLRQLRILSVEDNGLKTLAMIDNLISLEVRRDV